jgi:hypothetical protein
LDGSSVVQTVNRTLANLAGILRSSAHDAAAPPDLRPVTAATLRAVSRAGNVKQRVWAMHDRWSAP